jgi:hypothetical protein
MVGIESRSIEWRYMFEIGANSLFTHVCSTHMFTDTVHIHTYLLTVGFF